MDVVININNCRMSKLGSDCAVSPLQLSITVARIFLLLCNVDKEGVIRCLSRSIWVPPKISFFYQLAFYVAWGIANRIIKRCSSRESLAIGFKLTLVGEISQIEYIYVWSHIWAAECGDDHIDCRISAKNSSSAHVLLVKQLVEHRYSGVVSHFG